jgi:hypothetical protein
MIDDDLDLSKLFGKSTVKNTHIQDFRKDMLGELYQLVETALLGETEMTMDALEKRLAQIVDPTNIRQDKTAPLKMIDSYLADKNGKRVLKATVEFVKPFFLQVYQEKLEQEANRVLEMFDAEDT